MIKTIQLKISLFLLIASLKLIILCSELSNASVNSLEDDKSSYEKLKKPLNSFIDFSSEPNTKSLLILVKQQ